MYKKCENCYKDGKVPNEESCKKCEDDLKAKEQECEELKKQIMQKSEIDMFFNTPIEGWSSDPCGICKYKNCLTEIKEIAEKNLNIHTCAFKGCGYDLITKQILQKISEVEE